MGGSSKKGAPLAAPGKTRHWRIFFVARRLGNAFLAKVQSTYIGRLTPPVWLTHGSHVCPEKKTARKKLCSHLERGIRRSQLGTPCLLIFKCNEPFAMRTISGLNAVQKGASAGGFKGAPGGQRCHLRNPLPML